MGSKDVRYASAAGAFRGLWAHDWLATGAPRLVLMRIPELRPLVLPITRSGRHVLCALPELRGAAAVSGAESPSRFELCEAFGALLVKLSQVASLRIVIEDLHWADAGSIAMLDAVTRAARGQPLRVFATYRPEAVAAGKPLSQFIGRTSGRDGVLSLHLDALGIDDIVRCCGRCKCGVGRAAGHRSCSA